MSPRPLPAPVSRKTGSNRLRTAVVASDVAALSLGWVVVALAILPTTGSVASPTTGWMAAVTAGLIALHAAGAHQRRIARVRRAELAATSRAAFAPAGLLVLLVPGMGVGMTVALVFGTAMLWSCLLALSRAAVGEWIRGQRARGHLQADVLVVGTGRAREVTDFLEAHPHLGFDVVDTVELLPEDTDDTLALVTELARTTDATGVVVTDPGDPAVQPLLPMLGRVGLHVHVASGVQGLDLNAGVTSSLAGELFLDFAPQELPDWEVAAIRAVDVAVAGLGILLSAPLWLAIAVAIRLTDGGSILYVQERVGLRGRPFPMMKFRSMRAGADKEQITDGNGREGPLTKIAADPRITRVGRFIRATSLDELPQLLNVLRGDMSIVGPRPALPSEHEQFDAELQRRVEVRPGLTGLWQVEGRDLPSFALYRRLDLLYVDNHSLALHVTTLLRTVTAVVGQTLRSLLSGSEVTLAPADAAPAHDRIDVVHDLVDDVVELRDGEPTATTSSD